MKEKTVQTYVPPFVEEVKMDITEVLCVSPETTVSNPWNGNTEMQW